MGDMAEDFRAWRKHKQEKKRKLQRNAGVSTARLLKSGLLVHRLGEYHYRVVSDKVAGGYVDYWPSSGRFRSKDGTVSGFGVGELIRIARGT